MKSTETELRQRIDAGSTDPDDYYELATTLAAAGQIDAASDVLERALALPLEPVMRALSLVRLAWLLQDWFGHGDRACVVAEQGLELLADIPETAEALFARGMLQSLLADVASTSGGPLALERTREAVRTLQRLVDEHAEWDEEEAWLEIARLRSRLGEYANAIPAARRFLEADVEPGKRCDGLIVLSEACRLAGQLLDAQTAAEEATQLARDHRDWLPLAAHQLGLVRLEAGRPAEARASFEEALGALDAVPVLRSEREWRKALHGRLAESHTALGEPEAAAAAWREALRWYDEADPNRARVLVHLGDVLYNAGSLADAKAAYEAVVGAPAAFEEDRAEAQTWVLWAVASLLYNAESYAGAADAYERLLDRYREDDADRRKVLTRLGTAYYSMGRFAWARARYETVLASPDITDEERVRVRPWAERSAARVDYDAGRYAEAAQAFERVLGELAEDDADRYGDLLWLGSCYAALAAYQAARECYESVLTAARASDADRGHARKSLAELRRRGV